MSANILSPNPTNPLRWSEMDPRRAESRTGALIGLAGAAALHLLVWLAIPGDLFDVAPGGAAPRYQEYSIELEASSAGESVATPDAAPGAAAPRMVFTETSGAGEAVAPGATDRFGVVSQAATSSGAGESEIEAEDAGGEIYNAPQPTPPPARGSRAVLAGTLGQGEGGSAPDWRSFFEPPAPVTPLRESVELVTEPEAEEVYPVEEDEEEEVEERLDGFGEPMPRLRLEQVPIGARRPLLSDAARYGESRLAVRKSPWGEYSRSMTERIRSRFDEYLAQLPDWERGGHVKVHFTLRNDGSVGDYEVETVYGSEAFRSRCVASVEQSQPFGPWSSTLVDRYGSDHRVTYEFFYDSEGVE